MQVLPLPIRLLLSWCVVLQRVEATSTVAMLGVMLGVGTTASKKILSALNSGHRDGYTNRSSVAIMIVKFDSGFLLRRGMGLQSYLYYINANNGIATLLRTRELWCAKYKSESMTKYHACHTGVSNLHDAPNITMILMFKHGV